MGMPLRPRELYDRHAAWLKEHRPNVHDLIDALKDTHAMPGGRSRAGWRVAI